MAKIAVVYKSKYGSAKQYAQWLRAAMEAQLLEMPVTAPQLAPFEKVIYVGGMYAGGVSGFSAFKKAWGQGSGKQLTLCAVGMAPGSEEGAKEITQRNLPPAMRGNVSVFQLRGALDYPKMSRVHRAMMWCLKGMLKLVKGKNDPQTKLIADSYGKRSDFSDKSTIRPVVAHVRGE